MRAVLDHKRHSGCYIASFALYGYRKHPADHNRLVLDPPAAAVVRKIFALYLAGHGTAKIAALLNKETIPPPAAYRTRQLGRPVPSRALWSKATVRRILATRTYAGDMEQGRVRKLNYKSTKTVRLPPQDWIVVPGTQEAIVDRADFDAVQRMLAARAALCVWTDTPAGRACLLRHLRREDGADRYGGAAVFPLPHGAAKPRGLPRSALPANGRRRGADAEAVVWRYCAADPREGLRGGE